MKKLKDEVYEADSFGWFAGHSGPGDTSLTRLGLSTKKTAPITFSVSFPSGIERFTQQYSVTSDSDDYDSKWMGVYWDSGGRAVYVHYC